MKSKVLLILVIIMMFVAGGTTYYVYSLYSESNSEIKDNPTEQKVIKTNINTDSNNKKIEEVSVEPPSKISDEEKSLKTSLTIRLDDIIQVSPETHDVYSKELSLPMTFINHTDKDIKGFHASTYYNDMFGELIFELEMKYEYDIIPANDSIQWLGGFDINQFNEHHMRLYTVPYENVVFKYEILSIYFMDGTVISK